MTPEALSHLHHQCFTTPRPWGEAEFAGLLSDATVFCLTQPGGFCLGRIAGPEAELLTLAVARNMRRQGLGRRLVSGFLSRAAERGASDAFLEVAADNQPAIALYRGAGFAATGTRKGYYRTAGGVVLDAIVMVRPLDSASPV